VNPHFQTHNVTQRNQNIPKDLREAYALFQDWSEDTEDDEVQSLYMDFASELHDHFENIREASVWFEHADGQPNHTAPEFYPLTTLYDMRNVVDGLVSHLAKLTNPESVMYDMYIDGFKKTLVELREIKKILRDAIERAVIHEWDREKSWICLRMLASCR
jgi:hypothetical protein